MKYVGVKTTGELRLHEVKGPQTDEIYMAVEDDKLGAVPIRPYEFVKWDGKKWAKVPNVQLVTTLDISAGTSQNNPLMNAEETERMILKYSPIEANTLRFDFSKKDYDPIVAGIGGDGTWNKVSKYANIWDWHNDNNDWTYALINSFNDNENLVSVIAAGDTSSVEVFGITFAENSSLISVVPFNTSGAYDIQSMFANCSSLKTIPLFDTSSVESFDGMCIGCSSLTSIPLFDTSSAISVDNIFDGCRKVESGALSLYQQLSTQAIPPLNNSNAFRNCGIDTVTGAAELAQIPESWGGTAPE